MPSAAGYTTKISALTIPFPIPTPAHPPSVVAEIWKKVELPVTGTLMEAQTSDVQNEEMGPAAVEV